MTTKQARETARKAATRTYRNQKTHADMKDAIRRMDALLSELGCIKILAGEWTAEEAEEVILFGRSVATPKMAV